MSTSTTKTKDNEVTSREREPVTTIWDGILLLSLAGIVDSARAQEIMDTVLNDIAQTRARIFILDILGVEAVDTAVANHLIKIVQASDLLGCKCVISGISPSVAQSLAQLGIPLSEVATRSTIRDALEFAFDRLDLAVVRRES